MVMSLGMVPGTISRSEWVILIDGNLVKDWVVANFRWVAGKGAPAGATPMDYMEFQLGVPLTMTEDSKRFMGLMTERFPREIKVVCSTRPVGVPEEEELPVFVLKGAAVVKYELLKMESQGTHLEGLDARSDWPVVQAVTFGIHVKAPRGYVGRGDSDEG